MRGPDFVREFPALSHVWKVFHGGSYLCQLTASLLDVAHLDEAIVCEIDSYHRWIELL